MIQSYENFKAQEHETFINGYEPIPAGGYVAQIKKAELVNNNGQETILLTFDIDEGEYTNYFQKAYDESTGFYKKWKGVYRLSVPNEKSEWYKIHKRNFEHAIYCFQESNGGYVWNWNETSFIYKHIGVLFRNKEWEYEGRTGWTTECSALTTIQKIQSGDFSTPKDKPLKKAQPKNNEEWMNEEISDDELPF